MGYIVRLGVEGKPISSNSGVFFLFFMDLPIQKSSGKEFPAVMDGILGRKVAFSQVHTQKRFSVVKTPSTLPELSCSIISPTCL